MINGTLIVSYSRIQHSSERCGHGHVEVDGCPRGGGENGRRNISEEFRVDVDLRQRSAINSLRKLLYDDDLAVVADSEADLQERLVDWKEIFGKYGLRVSLEKTGVLSVWQQKKILT